MLICQHLDDYEKIESELKAYDESLANKPQIIIANKMDLDEAEGHSK